jgi:dihydroorotate dehydrogenase electron transfer subunit
MFSKPTRVLEIRDLGSKLFIISVESEELSRAMPGQFATISLGRDDPLVPRPFSVFNAGDGRADFLVKIKGRATALLARLAEGDTILATGPLGRPLPEFDSPVLVAGGVGVAPLAFYARKHAARLLLGLPDPIPGLLETLSGLDPVVIYENTHGGGTVVDLVKEKYPSESLYIACGPWAMVRALLEAVPAERVIVLAEGMMACGVGTCLVCALPAKGGKYMRVCTEGPWFRATDIDFTRPLE